MTLNEAIKHCEEKSMNYDLLRECRNEYRQLAQWLSELKMYRYKNAEASGSKH